MDEEFMYCKNLKGEIEIIVNDSPTARVHRVEWKKIMEGQPVEINPSIGEGFKVMNSQALDVIVGLGNEC